MEVKRQTPVEWADLQQEFGQHPEIIQGFQQPHRELQEHAGNQRKGARRVVKIGIQGRILHIFHGGLELAVDIIGSVPGI